MSETNSPTENVPSNQPWYAIRTFNCQERKVSRYLAERGYIHFIPMTLGYKMSGTEKVKEILIPAVHNILFVQKKGTRREMEQMFRECVVPVSIFCYPGSRRLCEIPARDMTDLRLLCDPKFETTLFVGQGEAEAMVGKDVRVVAGPFKGSVGRLVRKNKQYYFLKTVIGMGVMVRVSRWYCEQI